MLPAYERERELCAWSRLTARGRGQQGWQAAGLPQAALLAVLPYSNVQCARRRRCCNSSRAARCGFPLHASCPHACSHVTMRQRCAALLPACFAFALCAVMSGIAAGAGKQAKGFVINMVAHWGFALPTALVLGFHFGLGVEGLYLGASMGPVVQAVFFTLLVWRLDWEAEASQAHSYILQVAGSTAGAGI